MSYVICHFAVFQKTVRQQQTRMEPTKTVKSEIANFYAGKTVLVTGATGFLGKVTFSATQQICNSENVIICSSFSQIILEKLLRSCPDVETVFILMRSKKEQNIIERTDKLFTDYVRLP